MGLTVEDVADEYGIELWPDTERSIYLFIELRTQWRFGFGGPVGMDYTAAHTVMRLRGLSRPEQAEAFDDLRVMEDEALRVIAEESK